MLAAAKRPAEAEAPAAGGPEPPGDLARIYQEHFDFVWRSARRLGVPDSAVDDVVQEVFIVVHRQLATFEGRSSMKTWLFGILRNLVLRQRRSWARRGREEILEESAEDGEPRRLEEQARTDRAWRGHPLEQPHAMALPCQ